MEQTAEFARAQFSRVVMVHRVPNDINEAVAQCETQYVVDPRHGFMLYNSDLVRVETYSAELNLRQPHEIELYSSTFEKLTAVASYGGAARVIINRVIADLAQATTEDGE